MTEMANTIGLGVLVLTVIVMFALDTERGRWWLARRQARRATRRIWRREGRRPRDPAVVRTERDREHQAQLAAERAQRLAAMIRPRAVPPAEQPTSGEAR